MSAGNMVLADRDFTDEQLQSLTEDADIRNVSRKNWERILSCCHAKKLRLYHITLDSLAGIERLRCTESLHLMWAPKVTDLNPLFRLECLTRLNICDFGKLRLIEGIGALGQLSELELAGNLGSLTPPLCLDSLRPLTALRNLHSLALRNVRLADGDITCLAELHSLRVLELSNQFDRAQFAFLAKRLNPQLEQPIESHSKTTLTCEACGAPQCLFTGRRMPLLCQSCDAERFQKLDEAFKDMVEAT